MNLVGNLVLGTATILLTSGAAMAADVIYPSVAAPAPMVMAPPAAALSFAGGYIGTSFAMTYPYGPAYGVQSGYNFVRGNFLFGIEVETSHVALASSVVDASLNGRAGVVLGDRVLAYAQAGIGTHIAQATYNVGGGLEVAITQSISMFAEYQRHYAMGGGLMSHQLTAGLNFRPGERATDYGTGDNWGGIYMGASGGYGFSPAGLGNAGVQAGYNLTFGRMVAGVEVETNYSFINSPIVNAALNGRAGISLGRALVYGELGIGSFLAAPIWTAGGGAEFAITDRLSTFAEANIGRAFGGGSYGTTVQGGLNFHFGR